MLHLPLLLSRYLCTPPYVTFLCFVTDELLSSLELPGIPRLTAHLAPAINNKAQTPIQQLKLASVMI